MIYVRNTLRILSAMYGFYISLILKLGILDILKMKINSKWASVIFLTVIFSTGTQANLIQNGGFEDISGSNAIGNYGSTSTWQIYSSIPDWDASRNMEIWTNNFIVPAYEGFNILELNGHPGTGNGAFSIFQSFATVVGQEYELSFAGRKRQDSTEEFSVSVGTLVGTNLENLALDYDIDSHEFGTWTEFNYIFQATDILSTLRFTSLDRIDDTTGNLLDDVSIVSVPEPSIIALLAAGLFGIGFVRRRQS